MNPTASSHTTDRGGAEELARPSGGQRRRAAVALAGCVLLRMGLAAEVASAQTAPVTVTVDARAAGTPLERIWPWFGYDEVNYTTTALGSALLGTLGSLDSTPSYIRPHFLLNTGDGVAAHKWGSTNVYNEDAAGNPIYNWTIQDGVMDTITRTGNIPFVEIGFMPQALSTRPTPYRNSTETALDGGCFYPPRDYDKWGALIAAWAAHAKQRYPAAVGSWMWELWNEPDIGYWHGSFAEYAKMYDFTEAALRGVLPDAVVGGPAVTGPVPFLQQFLQHCATGINAKTNQPGTRLDLITFHAKGGVALNGANPRMNLGNQLRLHRDGMATVASFPQYKQTPIVISEADPDGCAACSSPANVYRNSPAYGAYEVAMMKRSLELEARLGVNLKGLITWAFMFDDDPYFGIFRTLATRGLDKAVLNDFKLLGALRGQRLPVTSSGARPLDDVLLNSVRVAPDIDALATSDGSHVQVLVWNYHDDLVAVAPSPVHLAVTLPASFGGVATVTHLRVDEAHGDPHTVWVQQGSPANPSAAQRTQLEAATAPAPLEPARSVPITSGVATLDFALPRFGVSLVTFTSAAPAGDAGAPSSRDAGGTNSGASDAAADTSSITRAFDAASSEADRMVTNPGPSSPDASTGAGGTGAGGRVIDSGGGGAAGVADSAVSATGGSVASEPARADDTSGCSCAMLGARADRAHTGYRATAAIGIAMLSVFTRRRRPSHGLSRRARAAERG